VSLIDRHAEDSLSGAVEDIKSTSDYATCGEVRLVTYSIVFHQLLYDYMNHGI